MRDLVKVVSHVMKFIRILISYVKLDHRLYSNMVIIALRMRMRTYYYYNYCIKYANDCAIIIIKNYDRITQNVRKRGEMMAIKG